MLENLTLNDIKKIIREEGGIVSEIIPLGPIWVLFSRNKEPISINGEAPRFYYEKYAIEMGSFCFVKNNGIDGFREEVKAVIKNSKSDTVIFSLYTLGKDKHGNLCLRFSYINYYNCPQIEVSVEEAREIIKNPPENLSYEYVQDLKNIYCL